jgi:hypothetical protein
VGQLTDKEASRDFVNKIIKRDIELASKSVGKDIPVKEVYKILNQRLSLYEKAPTIPLVETDIMSLEYRKADISLELKMFKLKQDIKEQINQLNSQIGKLENQLVTLREASAK